MKTNIIKFESIIRIFCLIFLVLILSIRGDTNFPFSPFADSTYILWTSIFMLLLIAIAIIIFFKPALISKHIPESFGEKISSKKAITMMIIVYSFLAILGTLVVFYRSNQTFSGIYSLNLTITISITIISFVLIALTTLRKSRKLIIIACISTALLSAIPILYFPITAKVADLMPIVQKQAEAFLHGEPIYKKFLLDNGSNTQAVRQPGTSVLFSPAVLLNFDPRILSVIYTLISVLFIFKFSSDWKGIRPNSKFFLISFAIIIFLIFPYRLLRIDIYEPPFWALITSSLYFLYLTVRDKNSKFGFRNTNLILFIFLWSIGIFTQVWFWLFSPFVSLYLLKEFGWKKAVAISLGYLALALALLAPFIFRDVNAYIENAFGFYQKTLADKFYFSNNLYLTSFMHRYGLSDWVTKIQFLLTAAVGFISMKFMKSFESLIFFLCLAYFVFIQFNALTWNYFYINLILLMIIYFALKLRKME